MLTQRQCFEADRARLDAAFRAADAIRTEPDGFQWIDERKVPSDLVATYRHLIRYGYANGLMLTPLGDD